MGDPFTPGHVLAGRYRLEARLGEGGMGSIWRAEHLVLAAPVAVKLLDPEIAEDPDSKARFLREAQAAAALRSPHVVQILDYGVDAGSPFIVMELLVGETLAQRIKRTGRLAPGVTARVVAEIARAVGRAHDAGIVHRDLKPENVFLLRDDDTEVSKVLDFGVAKFSQKALQLDSGTRTGSLLGTPFYMSPEQAQGDKTVDHRSDLWALGVIAYESLTGKRPFESDHLGDLVLQICVRDMPVPSSAAPLPAGFDAWFARATARDPEQRFQSARELADALREALEIEQREGRTTLPDDPQPPAPEPAAVVEGDAHATEGDAPTLALKAGAKGSHTLRQFGTASGDAERRGGGGATVLTIASVALLGGLVAGLIFLRGRPTGDEEPQRDPAVTPAPPARAAAQPQGATPTLPAPTRRAAARDAARDDDRRRERGAPEGTGHDAAPAARSTSDAGWVKPAWAIPDDALDAAGPAASVPTGAGSAPAPRSSAEAPPASSAP